MKPFYLHLALSFLLILSACASDGDEDKEKEQEKEKLEQEAKEQEEAAAKRLTNICPQVAILRELEGIRDYGTEKADPAEFVAAAKMVTVSGECEYQEEGVDISYNLRIQAGKGPRLGGNRATFPYFVAVVDPGKNIVSKEKMTLEVRFPSDSKLTESYEEFRVFIPLTKEQREMSSNYQVLMGFQLTQEQLDALRAERNQK
ncbi:MAG: hypothetical protein WAO98_06475 [Alphaproteobacteria bacterium]